MAPSLSRSSPHVLSTSAGRGWRGLDADVVFVPRGRWVAPGGELHGLGIHFGPPVNAECECGGRRMRRVQKPGDIDVVPAGTDGSWEDDADCRILRVRLQPSLLHRVAGALGRDPDRTEIAPRLQLRDTRIEAIGWAIKTDLEADTPSDPLYIDHLASALAVRLIETASDSGPQPEHRGGQGLSARQLRILT